jgi:hypothetical protein
MYSGFYFHYEIYHQHVSEKIPRVSFEQNGHRSKSSAHPKLYFIILFIAVISFILWRTHNVTNAAGTLPKESQPDRPINIIFLMHKDATHFSEGGI